MPGFCFKDGQEISKLYDKTILRALPEMELAAREKKRRGDKIHCRKDHWIQVSIVKMQKIAVIGLDKQKESIMSRLMDFGAVELTDQKNKLSDETLSSIVTLDDSHAKAMSLTPRLSRAENALLFWRSTIKAKEPLF